MPLFAITTDAGTFAVTEWAAPVSRVLGREDRTCRIGVSWTPAGVATEARGCPAAVATEAAHAVASWGWTAPSGFDGHVDLGEVWFVYPFELGEAVRVLVRQSDARDLTLPDGVDPVPFAIQAWSFVRYPAEVHRAGNPEVVCAVDVHADRRGFTREVVARGCPAPFRAAAEDAISEWRFVPPLVDGEPIPSALTLSTTFSPHAPPTARSSPDHARRALWEMRAFDQLTRDERVWFIRATLLGSDVQDLGPGHVRIALPGPPDLGARASREHWLTDGLRPAAPLPDHPPVLVLGRPDHHAVEIYELTLPDPSSLDPAARGTRCDVLVQVDGERRVFSWAEACDAAAREPALRATDAWVLRHDGAPVSEDRVQLHVTLVFDESGAATVRLDADEVRTPRDALPPGVHTFRNAKPVLRVPPKLPPGVVLPNEACDLAVQLDDRGRPAEVEVLACPEGFAERAERAVRRWRWRPAEEDGEPVRSSTSVVIRFG